METSDLAEKRSFKTAFEKQRCLVVADGFFEWKKEGSVKKPHYIRLKSGTPFGFAGLYNVWKSPEGEQITTSTIITTDANELIKPIHDRMPVILPEKHFEQWLDRTFKDTASLKKFLLPYPATKMKAYRVSTVVSSSRNDVPECVEPLKKK